MIGAKAMLLTVKSSDHPGEALGPSTISAGIYHSWRKRCVVWDFQVWPVLLAERLLDSQAL
jgi:hypothetical protein